MTSLFPNLARSKPKSSQKKPDTNFSMSKKTKDTTSSAIAEEKEEEREGYDAAKAKENGTEGEEGVETREMRLLPPGKCQSYMAIFEDALDQLAVLGDISHEGTGRVEGGKAIGNEITRIIKDQKSLETKYQRLIQEQEQLKSLPNKTKYKESQVAILDVTNEMQQTTHDLAKNLKSHPSVAQNLLKIQNERSSLQTLISKTIRELREYKFDSLLNTVEEEYKKKNTLQHTIQQENAALDTLKGLQRELGNEKVLLEEDKNDRNLVIQQLKDTIQEISALTTSEQKYIKKETKAHEASVKQQCQHKENQLLEEKANLLKQIEQEKKVHDKVADFLSHQRQELDGQIQEWMVKYEEDTESKAKELEDLKQQRTQDLDKFEELVAAYEELERVVEEDKETRRKLMEEHQAMQLKEKACRQIQRWWRRLHVARVTASKSAKKPKGKGGKGKKAAKSGKKPKSK